MKTILLLWLSFFSFSLFAPSSSPPIAWQEIDKGLFFASYLAPQTSSHGDSKFSILRIDPKQYELKLYSAKQPGETTRTAAQWAEAKGLLAVINAGMYQGDFATNVGYMKIGDFINNPRLNQDNCIAAFGAKNESLPPFQIIDRRCQDWDAMKNQYQSFTQSIRMVDCRQINRWSQQPRKWSMVVLGRDQDGNALFIFTRSPYPVHDFIDMLLAAPLDLYNLMYLEGGPEASFYLNHQGFSVSQMGSYETGFNEDDNNREFWPIPNVIGVVKRE
jgi:uncharacterized protein YigE (DUF2233 family)